MSECIVGGTGGGAKVLSGALFVPKNQSGAAIDLGGLPKIFVASALQSAQFGANSPAVCFAPAVGSSILPTSQSSGYINMAFTSTGLSVNHNSYPADTTIYWLAVM